MQFLDMFVGVDYVGQVYVEVVIDYYYFVVGDQGVIDEYVQ